MGRYMWKTNDEIMYDLALRVKNIRKRRSITQQQLSYMSGVSYGSIKRFETSGEISLYSLIRITRALDIIDEIDNLFTQVEYKSIEEILNE
jgi:transcriptional regulator with XRE-family HTH domain